MSHPSKSSTKVLISVSPINKNKGVPMKHIILSMITAITLQAQATPPSLSDLVDDPCAGAIQCSPGNDGDMSAVEVKKTYSCILLVSDIKNPLMQETIAQRLVQTSGEGKFTSFEFGKNNISVKIDTNFAAIRRITITHQSLGTQAFVDGNDLAGKSDVPSANLIDTAKKQQYTATCYVPLK